jgi:hypothetical protein
MKYSTPELVVIGSESSLVLGVLGGIEDSFNPDTERPAEGFVAGLDD